MTHISSPLAALVRERAGDHCEYCRLPQFSQEATFHLDHVHPQVAGGESVSGNLALACVTCSLRKGARTRARDPRTGRVVPLFHPRQDRWSDHFRWTARHRVIGRTASGRVTVKFLGMNRPAVLAIRQLLAQLGLFPPEFP